jgi:hypothetical protein
MVTLPTERPLEKKKLCKVLPTTPNNFKPCRDREASTSEDDVDAAAGVGGA